MIIVEGSIVVQKNREHWKKGHIPLKGEDLERLNIVNLGKTDVLVFIFRKGESYDSKNVKLAKATFEKIEELNKEIIKLRADAMEEFK